MFHFIRLCVSLRFLRLEKLYFHWGKLPTFCEILRSFYISNKTNWPMTTWYASKHRETSYLSSFLIWIEEIKVFYPQYVNLSNRILVLKILFSISVFGPRWKFWKFNIQSVCLLHEKFYLQLGGCEGERMFFF